MKDDATTLRATTDFDVLLPSQWCAPATGVSEPDRRLRLAVLENAISYFQRYVHATDRRGRMLHEDALDWLSESDRSDFFSFENVCDALGLDPDYLRTGLLAWRTAERARAGGPTSTNDRRAA
mgnify:CR=1 FL=1